jgi:predicted  nucleic acid-binding Zn-ribbon protein
MLANPISQEEDNFINNILDTGINQLSPINQPSLLIPHQPTSLRKYPSNPFPHSSRTATSPLPLAHYSLNKPNTTFQSQDILAQTNSILNQFSTRSHKRNTISNDIPINPVQPLHPHNNINTKPITKARNRHTISFSYKTNTHNNSNMNCNSNDNIRKECKLKKGKTPQKKKAINYQMKYEKLKKELEGVKNELVKERKKGNEIKKQLEKYEKKELQYNEILQENKQLIKLNEEIYNKIKESENIRNEQQMLVESLQREYEQIKRCMYNQSGEVSNEIEQNVNYNIPQSKSTVIIDKPKLKNVKRLTPNRKSSKTRITKSTQY